MAPAAEQGTAREELPLQSQRPLQMAGSFVVYEGPSQVEATVAVVIGNGDQSHSK